MKRFIVILTVLVLYCGSPARGISVPEANDAFTTTTSTTLFPKEKDDSTLRLVEQNEESLHGFPFLVSLQTHREDLFCTGTIIQPNWILTAASCLAGLDAKDVLVIAGRRVLSAVEETEQARKVNWVAVHPRYNLYDAAVMRLEYPLDTNSSAVDCLPTVSEGFKVDYASTGSMIGWEFHEEGEFGPAAHEVQVPLIPTTVCAQLYKNVRSISPNHVCAGSHKNDGMCLRIPGQPLLCSRLLPNVTMTEDKFLCGIASLGRVCEEGSLIVFTSVSSINDWIIQTIQLSKVY